MTNKVFLDTSYAIALSVESDSNHQRALEIAQSLEASQTKLITTRAILLEIGNSLAKQRYRHSAGRLLRALEHDPTVEIAGLSDELYHKAFELFQNRPDKAWGLIDCVSFVVMTEKGLTDALTTDVHFEQAGYTRLLGERE